MARITERAFAKNATSFLPHVQLAQATSYIAQGRCREAEVILQSLAPLAAGETLLAIRLDAGHGSIAYITGEIKESHVIFDRVIQAIEGKPDHTSTSLRAGIAASYAALGI